MIMYCITLRKLNGHISTQHLRCHNYKVSLVEIASCLKILHFIKNRHANAALELYVFGSRNCQLVLQRLKDLERREVRRHLARRRRPSDAQKKQAKELLRVIEFANGRQQVSADDRKSARTSASCDSQAER